MSIVVGTDFSPAARFVEDAAADLARRRGEDLVLAHVVDGPLLPHSPDADRLHAAGRRIASDHSCATRGQLLFDGNVGKRLAELAEAEHATLLVIGAHGAGRRSPLGSVARVAIRQTTRPLLVVRDSSRLWLSSNRVRALATVAIDETDAGAKDALALLSATGDLDAELVHYQSLPENHADRVQAKNIGAREARDQVGVIPVGVRVVSICIRDGATDIPNNLCELARQRDADVIVCGSHRRHGLARVLEGSLAERIAELASVSVLVGAGPQRAADSRGVAFASLREDNATSRT